MSRRGVAAALLWSRVVVEATMAASSRSSMPASSTEPPSRARLAIASSRASSPAPINDATARNRSSPGSSSEPSGASTLSPNRAASAETRRSSASPLDNLPSTARRL